MLTLQVIYSRGNVHIWCGVISSCAFIVLLKITPAVSIDLADIGGRGEKKNLGHDKSINDLQYWQLGSSSEAKSFAAGYLASNHLVTLFFFFFNFVKISV